nr:polysaccharide biosynthesis/export family protein [Prochlorococcus marinus]
MNKSGIFKKNIFLTLIISLINSPINLIYNSSFAKEQNLEKKEQFIEEIKSQYILGPGDLLSIKFLYLPELNFQSRVGPDGFILLPRIDEIKVENLTLSYLKEKLEEKFGEFLRFPDLNIEILEYRPIKVFINGEVAERGIYTLQGNSLLGNNTNQKNFSSPKIYDAIKAAGGIRAFSDLSKIKVVRNFSDQGKIYLKYTFLDFRNFLKTGIDDNQNIRVYDGDTIEIGKSDISLTNQLIDANKLNINPKTINVYVTGRVREGGNLNLPRGATLNQAVAIAGGPKPIRGKLEFFRISSDGQIIRRTIKYNNNSSIDNLHNPILESGDIIRFHPNIVSNTTEILGDITSPFVSIFALQNLFSQD